MEVNIKAQEALASILALAESTGDYHDLIISCEGRTWKIHRLVVCNGSKYFNKLCSSGFKEEFTGKVDLKDDDPSMVERMIHFLYSFDYSDEVNDPTTTSQATTESLAINAAMYIIADKYEVDLLKDLAKDKFSETIKEAWSAPSFPNIIETIYDNTVTSDRGLREALFPVLKLHQSQLRKTEAFMDVVRSCGDFAVDVIDAWTTPPPEAAATTAGSTPSDAKLLYRTFVCCNCRIGVTIPCHHCPTLQLGNR